MLPPTLALLLAGCSTLESLNPITLYHRLEGGKIAEQRPPPPGSDATDPNLASVPPKPVPPDRDAMKRLTQGLVSDRENARYSNAAAPLPDPSSPSASPSLFGAGTLPPPVKPAPAAAASASLTAASAPPAPPDQAAPVPAAAPRKPVDSAPLAVPESPQAAAEVPALPAEPPPRPAAAPVAAPAPPAVVTPLAAAPAPAGSGGDPVSFDPGSSSLSAAETETLKKFATQRKGAAVAVTGYGDAVSSDPAAQASALSLAIARARAVSAALQAAGVPANAIQVGGEAAGRGAFVRLLK
jgi:outer membrane protein OmpA-like peptidoglycan-associated protein